MQFDLEDVLAGSFGRILVLCLFIVSATWLGSLISSFALAVGDGSISGVTSPLDFLDAPSLLINLWIVPNVGFLALAVVYLLITDNFGYAEWGVIVGIESLFAMLGRGLNFSDPGNAALAWAGWLTLLTMLETGIWLIWQMKRNQWVRGLAELSAENAMLRAERDSKVGEGAGAQTE